MNKCLKMHGLSGNKWFCSQYEGHEGDCSIWPPNSDPLTASTSTSVPAQSAEVERLSKERDGLRKRVHFLEGHNQFFERCESNWCHPERHHKTGLAEADFPALTFNPVGNYRDDLKARAEAAESKLSQLLAACEKFLKQTTGKSPEEIVAILNGGQQ